MLGASAETSCARAFAPGLPARAADLPPFTSRLFEERARLSDDFEAAPVRTRFEARFASARSRSRSRSRSASPLLSTAAPVTAVNESESTEAVARAAPPDVAEEWFETTSATRSEEHTSELQSRQYIVC